MKKFLLIISSILLIVSCEKETAEVADLKKNETSYIAILESMGFSKENIQEFDSYFIIEGDMVINKESLNKQSGNKLKQTWGGSPLDNSDVQLIRVQIANSISGWSNIINDAILEWNSIQSAVHFSIVSYAPDITIYGDKDANCPAAMKDLGVNTCGIAYLPYNDNVGFAIAMNMDSPHIPTTAQRLRTLTHELGHTIGFGHTNDDSYDQIPGTPNDASSLMNGGQCGQTNLLSEWDKISTCILYPNGEVSTGTTSELDMHNELYSYYLTDGKSPDNVVATAIAKSNDYCYIWYKDGTVTAGVSNSLSRYEDSYNYTLPSGKQASDIVGIGIAPDDKCYFWYNDGTVSSGTTSDLDYYKAPYSYSIAPGKSRNDILGIGIAGSNSKCYVWYNDGTVSSGTTSDLDYYTAPYSYSIAPGKNRNNIVGLGIASNDYCYVWFK